MSTENKIGLGSAGSSAEKPFIIKLMQAMVNKAKIFEEDTQPRTNATQFSAQAKRSGLEEDNDSLNRDQFVVDHLQQMGASEGLMAWMEKYMRLRRYEQGDSAALLPEDKPFLKLRDRLPPPETSISFETHATKNSDLPIQTQSTTHRRAIHRRLKPAGVPHDDIDATASVPPVPAPRLASTRQEGVTKPYVTNDQTWPGLIKIDLRREELPREVPLVRINSSEAIYTNDEPRTSEQAQKGTSTEQEFQAAPVSIERASTTQIASTHTRETAKETATRELSLPLYSNVTDGAARPSTSKDKALAPPQLQQQVQQPEEKRFPNIVSSVFPEWVKVYKRIGEELGRAPGNTGLARFHGSRFHFTLQSVEEYHCILRNLDALKEEGVELNYYCCWPEEQKALKVALRGVLTAPLDTIKKVFEDRGYPIEAIRHINTRDGRPSGVIFIEFDGPPRDLSEIYTTKELLGHRVTVEPWRGKKRGRGKKEPAVSTRERRF